MGRQAEELPHSKLCPEKEIRGADQLLGDRWWGVQNGNSGQSAGRAVVTEVDWYLLQGLDVSCQH